MSQAPETQFFTCFSGAFALLGLKLLFGQKPVTLGSVVLLACVSGAMASAWSGSGGAFFHIQMQDLYGVYNRMNYGGVAEVVEAAVGAVAARVFESAKEREVDEL